MVLKEIIESLIRSVNAGEATLENTDPLYIRFLLPSLRAQAISIMYNGSKAMGANKFIHPDWIQNFDITIDTDIQTSDSDYLIANAPTPLSINSQVSGLVFFGKKKTSNPFVKAQSLSEIGDLKKRGYINDGEHIIFLPVAADTYWIYGDNMLKSLHWSGILNNPYDAPNWNDVTSLFPINELGANLMRDLYKSQVSLEIQQPKDIVNDGAATSNLANTKSNTR